MLSLRHVAPERGSPHLLLYYLEDLNRRHRKIKVNRTCCKDTSNSNITVSWINSEHIVTFKEPVTSRLLDSVMMYI